jgi:hypothetical protein
MKFDSSKFELLQGIDAANYAIQLIKEGITERDFLPYFQENVEKLDMAHLELAVGMVGKIGSIAAFHVVAKYLDHPNFNVRFVAVKTIKNMVAIDEQIMALVVASLTKQYGDMGDALAQELNVVLDRPASDEAKRLAAEYKKNNS